MISKFGIIIFLDNLYLSLTTTDKPGLESFSVVSQ